MLKGTGASDGIGIGKILVIEEVSLAYTPHAVEDTDAELQRFKTAVDAFIVETQAQAEALKASAGAKEAEIMQGHISMVQRRRISSGAVSAPSRPSRACATCSS